MAVGDECKRTNEISEIEVLSIKVGKREDIEKFVKNAEVGSLYYEVNFIIFCVSNLVAT